MFESLRRTISFYLHGGLQRNFRFSFSEEKLWPKEVRWYSVYYCSHEIWLRTFLLKPYIKPNHAASCNNQYNLLGRHSWGPGISLYVITYSDISGQSESQWFDKCFYESSPISFSIQSWLNFIIIILWKIIYSISGNRTLR